MALTFYRAVVRWAFERFYREFSWTYPAVAWLVSRGLWKHWTLAALPYLQGHILELGCGTGYVQHALVTHRPGDAIGIDASPFMLSHTRRRLQRSGLIPHLIHGRAQTLPCASATFDSVLATFPSEYICDPRTLAEIRRVLAPSGSLIIVDGARFNTTGWYEWLVDVAYKLTFQASIVREAFPPNPYLNILEPAGFAVDVFDVPVGASRVMVMRARVQTEQGTYGS